MMDAMTLFFNRKPEACFEFLERVGSTLVVDYKSYVSVEMWLQLIYFRLQNFFYRSQDQLWFDLDLVTHCSFIYNGEDDELTIKARGCVEKIRKELKNMINQNHEKKIQQQKAKQFTINNEQENLFGFTDISVSPVKNM
jgi:low affinity Fe/Cu permease